MALVGFYGGGLSVDLPVELSLVGGGGMESVIPATFSGDYCRPYRGCWAAVVLRGQRGVLCLGLRPEWRFDQAGKN